MNIIFLQNIFVMLQQMHNWRYVSVISDTVKANITHKYSETICLGYKIVL